MFVFSRTYFIFAAIFFIILVFIAAFVRDHFVRPYFGDYLLVIFLYCFARAFLRTSIVWTAVGVLLFSYLIEVLQHFNFLQFIGLEDVTIARIILGNGFAWWDLVAYTLGGITILTIEFLVRKSIASTENVPN